MSPSTFLPSFSRRTSVASSSSSISSTSSTSSFRAAYTKDGQGFNYDTAYQKKYGSASSSSSQAAKPIDRLVYAKDARGVDLSAESYPYSQELNNSTEALTGYTFAGCGYAKDWNARF